jgi:hypothetical protein
MITHKYPGKASCWARGKLYSQQKNRPEKGLLPHVENLQLRLSGVETTVAAVLATGSLRRIDVSTGT